MAGVDVKKYIGATGDALVYAWQRFKGVGAETEPPLGSKDTYKGNGLAVGETVGGISIGTILLIGVAWFLFKR